jgi:hypothetical protein
VPSVASNHALAAVNSRLQEALGRCAASIEGSAQDVLMLRDDITAAAAAADTAATSDLQDLKLLSSAQSRLSNTVQARPIQFNSIQFNSIQFNSIQFNSIQFNSAALPSRQAS